MNMKKENMKLSMQQLNLLFNSKLQFIDEIVLKQIKYYIYNAKIYNFRDIMHK